MPDEPTFMAVGRRDPEYQKTITDAQNTLGEFCRRLPDLIDTNAFPSIKTPLVSGDNRINIWLTVDEYVEPNFVATIFEIPAEFDEYQVGDRVRVPSDAVLDWMYRDGGTVYGAYSLRYQRSLLAPEEWAEFDERVGVDRFA